MGYSSDKTGRHKMFVGCNAIAVIFEINGFSENLNCDLTKSFRYKLP